jgi:glutaredoxin
MEQRCTILNLYLNWLLYLGGATFFLVTGRYLLFFVWAFGTPLVQVAYVRLFPRLSKVLGYGSVTDVAATTAAPAPVSVTLYTAAGCPFCPIIEARLEALKNAMGFTLTKIDVTMRPDLLTAKKIKAVPVVEVGTVLRTGNLTSQELAALIGGSAAAATS